MVRTYREGIRPPWWLYATAVILVLLFSFTFAAVITLPVAAVVFVLLSGVVLWVVDRRKLVLYVDETTFHVGEVDIARDDILDAVALDRQGLWEVAGPDADGRATMVLRNLATKQGVKVDLASGSSPYWLISSRKPKDLASCLNHGA